MIACVLLPHTYQVTKYNPADRDERGRNIGVESRRSDHGPVELAYLAAVDAFAQDSGVTRLAIREPGLVVINFGLEPRIDGYGLAGLFPPDLSGYHDGAQVSIIVGLELLRAMLRDNGAFCRLEVEDRFLVHVGFDQYVYVGSAVPCLRAVAFTHQRGLFAEPIDASPLATEFSDDTAGERRPADAAWWARLGLLVADRGAVVLEEGYVLNAARWHRLTAADVEAVRARLAPRSRLLVWPDLSTDVDGVLAGLAPGGLVEVVWQGADGRISSRLTDEDGYAGLPALLAGARAAMVVSGLLDQRHPLLTGVLPDGDGVLRARWSPQ
jgi:small subunit ribosomal protein S1